jgi:2-methylisocitrate lyase-like PEP mutase family enzyme
MDQHEQAAAFRAMHVDPPILVLPNAWDVASAVLIARHPRCRAVATSSAGVAWALGYPDGQRIPRDEMLEVVRRIGRAVDLPVTADLEAGYGDPGGTAEAAWAAGAVGLNLEDGDDEQRLVPLEEHAERVRAVRAAAAELVINARTDVYLTGLNDLDEAVARGNAYLAAGADCVFVPGAADADTIGRLVDGIDGPVSVLAFAKTPPVAELERLGVARVSVGGGPARVAYTRLDEAVREYLEEGTFGFLEGGVTGSELNRLLG